MFGTFELVGCAIAAFCISFSCFAIYEMRLDQIAF